MPAPAAWSPTPNARFRPRPSVRPRAEVQTDVSSAVVHRFQTGESSEAAANDTLTLSPAHQQTHALWMRTQEAARTGGMAPKLEEPAANPLSRFATFLFRASTNQGPASVSHYAARPTSLWLPANGRTPELPPGVSRADSDESSHSSGGSRVIVAPSQLCEPELPAARGRTPAMDGALRSLLANPSNASVPSRLTLSRGNGTIRCEPSRLRHLRQDAMASVQSNAPPARSAWSDQEAKLADAIRRIDALPARAARGEEVDIGEFQPLLEQAARLPQH